MWIGWFLNYFQMSGIYVSIYVVATTHIYVVKYQNGGHDTISETNSSPSRIRNCVQV